MNTRASTSGYLDSLLRGQPQLPASPLALAQSAARATRSTASAR